MTAITHCRSCGSNRLDDIFSLGEQYLSEFRLDDSKPPKYGLTWTMCRSCTLPQLRHTAPADEMFHDSYSFKSGISDAIGKDLKSVVDYALEHAPDAESWLDIASNDGTLLSNVPKHIYRVGVDPLRQFAAEAARHADQILLDFFKPEYFSGDGYYIAYGAERRRFDIITSVSMFYDLDDPNTFVEGVRSVLAPEGIWVIQQNYLPTMLRNKSLDNLSHEHLTYFSLTSLIPLLARHGLEVIDAELNPINGGCIRTLVTHSGRLKPERSVTKLLDYEQRDIDVANIDVLNKFANSAQKTLNDLSALVQEIIERGERIYVYGASTRGAVIWQAANLSVEQLPKVVERNPDKVGRYMSAIGSPIISEEEMRRDPPDYLLVGPWWLKDDFIVREAEYLAGGGHLIFPLPQLKVIGGTES